MYLNLAKVNIKLVVMSLYQLYIETTPPNFSEHSANSDIIVISRIFWADHDRDAYEKSREFARKDVLESKRSWLITIHKVPKDFNLDNLEIKSKESIELFTLLTSENTDRIDWTKTMYGDDENDPDLTEILDRLQDDGTPEVIEVLAASLNFKGQQDVLSSIKIAGPNPSNAKIIGIVATDDNEAGSSTESEKIRLRVSPVDDNLPDHYLTFPSGQCELIPYEAGRACLPSIRTIQKRQS